MAWSPRLTSLGLALTCVLTHAPPAGAWGSAGHHYIAQNYSQHLPPGMDGLAAWDAVVDAHVMDPDFRKGSTPGEGPRHFMDIDSYSEFLAGTLSHDRATLEAIYGAATVEARGVLPWAVGEVTGRLTTLFQQAKWDSSALLIADLCHYVGDGHQPLHCTYNYNGQYTGNNGIHSRYESDMLNLVIGDLHTPPAVVSYYPSPVDAMFDVIGNSWNGIPTVLGGDNTAKAAAGGSTSSTLYYQTLWQETQPLTEQQLDEASRITASYAYTAWVNAGQPLIPGSTGVETQASALAMLELSPNPARGAVRMSYRAPQAPTIEVFDARGARVTLIPAGSSSGAVSWTPGSSAARVAPGLYFVQLTAPGVHLVRRVAVLP